MHSDPSSLIIEVGNGAGMHWVPVVVLLGFFIYAWRINRATGLLPDRLNFAFTTIGIATSAVFPHAVGGATWWQGIGFAVLGALVSFMHGLLAAKVTKSLFGMKTLVYSTPVPFAVTVFPEHAIVTINGEDAPLEGLFTSEKDVAVVRAENLTVRDGQTLAEYGKGEFHLRYGWIEIGTARHDMIPGCEMFGVISGLTYQRDTIGFGALKMLMVPGAFLGWKGAIFVFWAAIAAGLTWGLILRCLRRPTPPKAQLEPFLIIGVVAWVVWRWPR